MRVHEILALIFILVSCSHAPASKSAREQNAYFEMGLSFYTDGRFPEAVQHFSAAYEADTSRSDILMHLALAHFKLEHFGEAEKLMLRACNQEEKYSECWNNLAVLYLRMNRYADAEKAARRALENQVYQTPEIALANLARANLAQGKVKDAEANISQAIRLNGDLCQPRLVMAKLLLQKKDFEGALRQSKAAVLRCPALPNAHHWEAFLYYKIGQRESAVAKFQKILNTFPNNAESVEKSRESIEALRKRTAVAEPVL